MPPPPLYPPLIAASTQNIFCHVLQIFSKQKRWLLEPGANSAPPYPLAGQEGCPPPRGGAPPLENTPYEILGTHLGLHHHYSVTAALQWISPPTPFHFSQWRRKEIIVGGALYGAAPGRVQEGGTPPAQRGGMGGALQALPRPQKPTLVAFKKLQKLHKKRRPHKRPRPLLYMHKYSTSYIIYSSSR